MSALILSDDQLQLLSTAGFKLAIADSQGRIVAMASPPPFSPDEINELKSRAASSEPRRTSAEVFARLQELAEREGESNQ